MGRLGTGAAGCRQDIVAPAARLQCQAVTDDTIARVPAGLHARHGGPAPGMGWVASPMVAAGPRADTPSLIPRS